MKSYLKPLLISFTMTSVVLTGFSCSHIQIEELPASADITAEINKLEANKEEALNEQVSMLSPVAFASASKALSEAKKSRAQDDDSKTTLRHVAEGVAYLKRAIQTAEVSRSALGDVPERRADALAAGAPKFAKAKFEGLDAKFLDVAKDIEDEDLTAASKSKGELSRGYSDVELEAIKADKLGAAAATIEQAIKEGAKENAGRTLAEAQKAQSIANAFITANRHDKAGIYKVAGAATTSANRLLDISRRVKVVEKKDSEALLLESEGQQKLLAAEKAAALNTRSQLSNAKADSASLEAKNEALTGEQRFQQRLDSAKAIFQSGEATVYRDGNKLVIRMSSLAFPIGKAVLSTSNFGVLAKVQRVINDLGQSNVKIEGHTDSTGDKTRNKKLSLQRAEAIQAYLSANGVGESSLSVEGYGDSKPITANNSIHGRAQNRRVDVIIDPVTH